MTVKSYKYKFIIPKFDGEGEDQSFLYDRKRFESERLYADFMIAECNILICPKLLNTPIEECNTEEEVIKQVLPPRLDVNDYLNAQPISADSSSLVSFTGYPY